MIPWLLLIVTLIVRYRLFIMMFLTTRWNTLNFMFIFWDSCCRTMLSHLFNIGQMIISLIYLIILYHKLSLFNFGLCLGFRWLQLWGVFKENNYISWIYRYLCWCGLLEPKVNNACSSCSCIFWKYSIDKQQLAIKVFN